MTVTARENTAHPARATADRMFMHRPPRERTPAFAAYRAPAPACPTGVGSKVGLEVMLIASVTLSEGHVPKERAPDRSVLSGVKID